MTLNRATPRKHVEWSLLINALVEIRRYGKAIRTGFVEDAMPDSSALWLAADAAHSRQMFESAQGHQVWVAPQELRPTFEGEVRSARPQPGTILRGYPPLLLSGATPKAPDSSRG